MKNVALTRGRPCEKHNSERQDDSLQLQDMVTNNVSWAWGRLTPRVDGRIDRDSLQLLGPRVLV